VTNLYILDTSVFITDPYAIDSFEAAEVVLPITILEELDKLKKSPAEVGRNARVAIKYLDELTSIGDVVQGVWLQPSKVKFRIDSIDRGAIGKDASYGDSQILACAAYFKETCGRPVVVVSKDINLRVRAKALGLAAEDYNSSSTTTSELYKGYKEVVHTPLGNRLQTNGFVELSEFERKTEVSLHENELLLINNAKGEGLSIGRRMGNKVNLIKPATPWGLAARNKEQGFLIDLLMDTSIPLVSVIGRAGSGKSLISLACCLELVLEKRLYKKLLICRPIQTIGNELGFLPGTMEEKIAPYYTAISDSFAFLFQNKANRSNPDAWKEQLFQYTDSGVIQQEPLTYMRGRSIPDALILLDEAQNLSKDEIKAILTRAGEGTKIILTGDVEQIDNRFLDAMNNGLTHVIDKFQSSHIAGHITLMKCERSELAEAAAELL
jgi:PhoH-like ATPase